MRIWLSLLGCLLLICGTFSAYAATISAPEVMNSAESAPPVAFAVTGKPIPPLPADVGTSYYVDASAGKDTNAGNSVDLPWKTMKNVNSTSFQPGDHIYFKRGCVWRTPLIVSSSGDRDHPVVYDAYGVGEDPIISGAKPVTGWSNYSGNIYVADIGSGLNPAPAQLYVDGEYYELAHEPNCAPGTNTPYFKATIDTTSDPKNDLLIVDDPDFAGTSEQVTGDTVVTRVAQWILKMTKAIDCHVPGDPGYLGKKPVIVFPKGSLFVPGISSSKPRLNYGFYLRDKLWMLNSPSEWYYDSTTGKLYLWTRSGDDPSGHNVEFTNRQSIVNVIGKNDVTILNLTLANANQDEIHVNNVNRLTIRNVKMSGGMFGIHAVQAKNSFFQKNVIKNALLMGIAVLPKPSSTDDFGQSGNVEISDNTIEHAGDVGSSPKESNGAIVTTGSNHIIRGNKITNSGYCGIHDQGNRTLIENNTIDRSCLILDDCAGIYTTNKENAWRDSIIRGNTITNSIGNYDGTAYRQTLAQGIYLDDLAHGYTVSDNTVINVDMGINIHSGYENVITGNKVYRSRGSALHIYQSGRLPQEAVQGVVHDNVVTGNFFEALTGGGVANYESKFSKAEGFGTFDNNTYCHPGSSAVISTKDYNKPVVHYTLPEWQAASGQDSHSSESCQPFLPLPAAPIGDTTNARDKSAPVSAMPVVAFYVSPNANEGGTGSMDAPFRTLEQARDAVRKINANMGNDIYVFLRAGTFRLDKTFELSAQDSGRNGHRIIYKAYNNEDVTISGGASITGWSQVGTSSLWSAPTDGRISRQLFVNGVRATRARADTAIAGWEKIKPDKVNNLPGGYRISSNTSSQLANWGNLQDVEIVSTKQWHQNRCKIDHIDSTALSDPTIPNVYIQEPCWSNSNMAKKDVVNIGIPDRIENAYELLDQPGEWYLDKTTRTIYYYPHPGETMTNVVVTMPVIETLIRGSGALGVNGSSDEFLENITFQGIRFAYTTWLQPESSYGFAEVQANQFRDAAGKVVSPSAAVEFEYSRNIILERNSFTHLGGMGAFFVRGVTGSTIEGNTFDDISSNGIQLMGRQLGDPNQSNMNNDIVGDNSIVNNYITGIGAEYPGAIGILAEYVNNTSISNNDIENVPYSGISIGWGWNIPNGITGGNSILHNLIVKSMQSMDDGGGIYNVGQAKDDKPEELTKIAYNVITDIPATALKGRPLYMDQGSGNILVDSNVGLRAPASANVHMSDGLITFSNNYWEATGTPTCILGERTYTNDLPGGFLRPPQEPPGRLILGNPNVCPVFINNHTISQITEAPSEIVNAAGLSENYQDIKKTNIR